MSHVTNVILSYSVMEEEEERLAEVNAFFNEREGKFDDAANDHYGGSKFIERPTYGEKEEGLCDECELIEARKAIQ